MNKRPVGLTILMVVNTLIGANAWMYFVYGALILRRMEQTPGLGDWHSFIYSFLLGLLCFVTANGFRTRGFRTGFLGGIALGVLLLIYHFLNIIVWNGWWVAHIYPIPYAVVLLGLLVFRFRRQFKDHRVGEAEDSPGDSDAGEPDAPVSARFRSRQRVLIAVNLLLGVVLWLGYCTDYSFRGDIADVVFVVGVTLFAGITWRLADRIRDKSLKRFRRLACLPSLLGGGPFLVLIAFAIVLLPFSLLAVVFLISEVMGESVIQRALSPDGTRIANVHFRPVGAYTGGNGHIFVRVIPRWMSILERVVYVNSRSYADEDKADYLHWIDNQTLRITGEPEERGGKVEDIKVGHVQFTVPIVFGVLFAPAIILSDTFGTPYDGAQFNWNRRNADLEVLREMVTAAMADDHFTVEELQEVATYVRKMKELRGHGIGQFGEQGSLTQYLDSVLQDNIITPEEQRNTQLFLSIYNDNAPWKGDADP